MAPELEVIVARINALEEHDPAAGSFYCRALGRASSYPVGSTIANLVLAALDRDLTELELAAWQAAEDAKAAARRALNAEKSRKCAANKAARKEQDKALTLRLKSAGGKK